jgi:hypothetical protein
MTTSTTSRRVPAHRRGVAMLLVIVAMVVAVVLTSAVIVSREVSPAIGANSTASVATAWSAESAANYAVGVIAGGFDWEAAIGPGGVLVESMAIGDASVDVTLLDMEGNVPDADDRDLMMTAVATIDGISTTVRRMISLGAPGDPIDAIDPRFGEFAILGVASISVDPGSQLGVWPSSPEAGLRPQVKLGTRFTSAADLDISLDAAISPIEMHVDITGDAGLVSEVAGAGYDLQWQMPLPMPVFGIALPGSVSAALAAGGDFTPPGSAVVSLPSADYDQIQIQNAAVVTIDGTVPTVVQCNDLDLQNATIRILGDVSILVREEMRIRDAAAIVLAADDARLTVYVGNDLVVESGAQLGVDESDAGRSAATLTTWVNPDRVRIIEVSTAEGGSGDIDLLIEGASTVLAAIHAPTAEVVLATAGSLIGRVTGGDITIGAGAAVWYCPTLDNRVGFSNPNGPLYEPDFSADPLVEQALDDAMASGATNVEQFTNSLRTTYNTLVDALVLGEEIIDGAGSLVESTTHMFTGLLGIE